MEQRKQAPKPKSPETKGLKPTENKDLKALADELHGFKGDAEVDDVCAICGEKRCPYPERISRKKFKRG